MGYKYFLSTLFFFAPLFGFSFSDRERRDIIFQENWPKYDQFGQISAVGTDSTGNIYIFHRGNRRWDYYSFSSRNIYNSKKDGPIHNETIVVLEPSSGSLLKKTGNNFFYLPHGLTVDHENNIWVTDVALHQVFKFPALDLSKKKNNYFKPNLTLGVAFEPGQDDNHFCKPTDVVVDKCTNDFFVSDGYCNSRIIKFDQFGRKLLTWGRNSVVPFHIDGYMLSVPHALGMAQEKKILYVADRENSRVVSYNSESGKFRQTFAEGLRSKIFSLAYSPTKGGLLFVLTNSTTFPKIISVYNADTGKFLIQFPQGNYFNNPHDLVISPDGQYCYVVELNPYKIWKFKIGSLSFNQTEEISAKQKDEMVEPVIAESKINQTDSFNVSNSILAIGLVVTLVLIGFLIFMFHCYKRKEGYRRYESRRLNLDDYDDYEVEEDGIRLT